MSAIAALGLSGVAFATAGDPSASSANYSVIESEIGGNGQFNSTSTNYNIIPNVDDGGSSLGEAAVGNSSSANYQSNAGFNTTAQPFLSIVVGTPTVAMGDLSTGVKTTATAIFNVKDYTSYGYVVQIIGNTPTYGGHPLTALTTDTASSAGTEQFGVNTVLNTGVVGSQSPQQVPPGFGFGEEGDGVTGIKGSNRPYTVTDKWRFNSGEVVASGPKSSGQTNYTMTFMANIATGTQSGQYIGNITLVATGTY